MRFKTDHKTKPEDSEVAKNDTTAPVVEEIKVPDTKLTELALGVWYNKQSNGYHLVKMKYDPVNKVAGEVEVGEALSLAEVGYYFRVTAGDTFL